MLNRRFLPTAGAALALALVVFPAWAADPPKASAADVARGRYLTIIGGCNDCHTEGYAPSDGKVPEKDWLQGSVVGFRGPWGTTYPANLRAKFGGMSEGEWIKYAQTLKTRPPMPWFTLSQWTAADLRAVYRFVRYLGPSGVAVPAYLPPDKQPPLPYVQWNLPPPK